MRDLAFDQLRLDVDHACFNKYLSYFHLITGVQIPFFLNHAFETKEFLKYRSVNRIWMFRGRTCPESWTEPHGLHVTNPDSFSRELEYVEERLGKIKCFSKHGFAPFVSGRLWDEKEIEFVEREYDVADISSSAIKRLTVSRMGANPEEEDLCGLQQIVFHPRYIRSHGRKLDVLLSCLIKNNPDLAKKILNDLRNVHRKLDEKCEDCDVNLWTSPEYDIIKYCPKCGIIWHIDDW